jgi:RNA polymerase sigma-70 factor (ECF subfamily)
MGKALEHSQRTDEELMALVADGDHGAATVLVSRHQGKLLNLFYRYTNDRLLAEDLSHEVFLRVYKSAPLYQPRAPFQVWLYRVAKNLCLNELKAKRVREHPPEQEAETPTPYDELVRAQREARVRRAIEELPERQRLVLILHRFEGFSLSDTAAVMETTPGAVEQLWVRAKARLKTTLADLLPGL